MSDAPQPKHRLSHGARSYLKALGSTPSTRGSRSVSYEATRVKQRPVTLPAVPFLDDKESA